MIATNYNRLRTTNFYGIFYLFQEFLTQDCREGNTEEEIFFYFVFFELPGLKFEPRSYV